MRVTRDEITLSERELAGSSVVDVRFDGHRVWTIRTGDVARDSDGGNLVFAWPEPVRQRLEGRTTISVVDTVDGTVRAEADVAFGDSVRPIMFVDRRGRWLAMTKWGTLGPVNDGRDSAVQSALAADAAVVVAALRELDIEPFLVGGALLGMVREGHMLGHDDDIDLAYLSAFSDPADLGAESFAMERALVARGFTVVRHSLAHLAVQFFDAGGRPERYVDIFTGFFRDGLYHQPFALRGADFEAADLLPTHEIEVEGTMLPVPHRPEEWLRFAYGPGWRVPDPSFVFPDTRAIVARFEGWFGSFNGGRDAWNDAFIAQDGAVGENDGEAAVAAFLDVVPSGARILDLGCGDGRWTRALASRGHRVDGVDFSLEALAIARDGDDSATFHALNVNDRAALLAFGADMLATGDEWVIFGHHMVQTLTAAGRQKLFQFLALVLRGDGFAWFTDDTDIAFDFDAGRPGTWHMAPEWYRSEGASHPLSFTDVATSDRADGDHRRRTATVRVDRAPARTLTEETA